MFSLFEFEIFEDGFNVGVPEFSELVGKLMFKLDDDDRAIDFRFIMGIGYGKDQSKRHEYVDPRIGRIRKIPFAPINVEDGYPRPKFDDIVKVVKR